MNYLPTDPIREEHRHLEPHLHHLERAAALVTGWSLDQARRGLPRLVAFLYDDLIPHARTEEDILYPAVDRITGANTTATMSIDHIVIGERTDRLAAAADTALENWDDVDLVADVSRQLAALAAIVRLHFRKEEEVLLPILDAALAIEEGHELFERMGHTAHTH